jgi:hypothetical protein
MQQIHQLDKRYFKGLEGQYDFELQFRIEQEGEEDYVVRNHQNSFMSRSVSADITLEAGKYFVLMKITASKNKSEPAEDVIKKNANTRREKLVQIGRSYDLAHAKAQEPESQKDEKERKEREAASKATEKQKLREKTEAKLRKEWSKNKKRAARDRRAEQKASRARARREAKKDKESGEDELPDGIPPEETNVEDIEVENDEPEGNQQDEPESENPKPADDEVENDEPGGTQQDEPESENPEPAGDKVKDYELDDMQPESSKNNIVDGDVNGDLIENPKDGGSHTEPGAPNESDTDSFCDFEFDSEIDMPSGEETESDDDFNFGYDELDDEDPDSDPWNAVCVVGLRVYSKDPNISLQVIKPTDEEDVQPPLDCDDPAVAAMKGPN